MKRITTQIELDTAYKIAAAAFTDAPNVAWMFKPSKQKQGLKLLFKLLLLEAKAKKGAYLSDNDAAILILHPTQAKATNLRILWLELVLALRYTGIINGIKALKQKLYVAKHRPKNGLVAFLLATTQNRDGISGGFDLKQGIEKLQNSTGQTVYAETTSPRVLKLYKAIGFEHFDTQRHLYADLDVWYLKRPPMSNE